jgi:hypothetical protein
MRQIIDGKAYDTDNAEKLATADNGMWLEVLYRTGNGAFFLAQVNDLWVQRCRLHALSMAQAKEWVEGHANDQYEKIFGPVDEKMSEEHECDYDLLKAGGAWLGAARSWMQRNKRNGSDVIWASDDVLIPHMTVRNCEEMAAFAVLADRNDRKSSTIPDELKTKLKRMHELKRMEFKTDKEAAEYSGLQGEVVAEIEEFVTLIVKAGCITACLEEHGGFIAFEPKIVYENGNLWVDGGDEGLTAHSIPCVMPELKKMLDRKGGVKSEDLRADCSPSSDAGGCTDSATR